MDPIVDKLTTARNWSSSLHTRYAIACLITLVVLVAVIVC